MTDPHTPPSETPVSPTEDRLGQFVEDALDRLGRGEPVVVESLLADRPDLVERGRELVRGLVSFHRSAEPVLGGTAHQESPPIDDPTGLPQPFPKDFLVTRLLGEGAYGRVWLAEDLHLPRQVALKTLRVPAGSDVGVAALAALRREAGFLVGVNHPNVVRVYSWLQSGGEHYLVLEYVSGGSLDGLVSTSPLPWERAVRYIADVAEGLMAAHALGVVHRDIKPANILWDQGSDEAKLTDFGVAGRLTDASTVIGTAVYMAPEAFRGRASEASDVYSLAATLFRLVTGEVPFRGANWDEQVKRVEQGLPDSDPRFAGLPESLEQIVRSGLASVPERRPTLRAFAEQLRGRFNQALADSLVSGDPVEPCLHLGVSREVGPGRWQTVAATRPPTGRLQRDMRLVPREPDQMRVRTGEWVRVEVTADRAGFVTVFNVGPIGNLNILDPDRSVLAGQPLFIPDVVFDLPAGRERVFAVWSVGPLSLTERDLLSLAEGDAGSRPYRASRDMRRVKDAVKAGSTHCCVAVLELAHEANA